MVVLGTYNMSFASDQGKAIGSEATFLNRMDTEDGGKVDRRYWNNALAHLKQFIIKYNPLAVGLQEMNLTAEDSGTGTDAVKKMLSELKTEKGEEYSYNLYSDKVTFKFGEPALSLIVNKKAGNITDDNIVIKDNKNQLDNDGNFFGGRPILMALTEKGTLLVNMHGAQNPGLGKEPEKFREYMKTNNKEELKRLVKEFVEERDKSIESAYIMGDFNDRYDAITEINFHFGTAKYEGESPASCCHNWDSMGNEMYRKKYGDFYQGDDSADHKKENLEKHGQLEKDRQLEKHVQKIHPDHGITVDDYINKGDKVFAYPKSGKLAIYESEYNLEDKDKNRVSKASDHELVYMEIPEPTEPAAAETDAEPAAETDAEPTEAAETDDEPTEAAVGGKKYKRKTAKRVSKSKNNKSKKGGKKTKKNNSKKAKKNKSKKSKK